MGKTPRTTDDGEAGQAARDMDLNRDSATVDPVQCGGWY